MNDPARFGWLDLVTPSPELAADFYGDLLGWELEPLDMETIAGYQLFTFEGEPVAGLIPADREGTDDITAAWLPSLLCSEFEDAVACATELGAEITGEVTELPGIGQTLVLRDLQMAAVALLREDSGGEPLSLDVENGRFARCDLLTSHLDDAAKFYSKLCGWTQAEGDISHRRSVSFRIDDHVVAGAWEAPADTAQAWWVPSVRTDDLNAAVARSARLGAQTIIPPVMRADGTQWAVVLDATGAPLGFTSL